jgi:FMN phosphatase YigB (HAD superfamily)
MHKKGFDYEEAFFIVEDTAQHLKSEKGFGKNTHPDSFVIAYKSLCEKYDRVIDDETSEIVWHIAAEVYNKFSPPYEYTHRILKDLMESNVFTMCVSTRGDKTVQLRRILDAQLAGYFDTIFVVEQKTPDHFRSICRYFNIDPTEAVMIGNHLVGDVLPALEAGLFGIFIPNGTSNIEKVLQSPPSEERFMHKLYEGKDLRSVWSLLERIKING